MLVEGELERRRQRAVKTRLTLMQIVAPGEPERQHGLMEQRPIFTSETQATRALGAEIRHDHHRFVKLLESVSGRNYGTLVSVQCEAKERIDVQLNFDDTTVGVEAKFDHAITEEQVEREVLAVDGQENLFLLLPGSRAAPSWLGAKFPGIGIIRWEQALGCFQGSRLTLADVAAAKTPKSTVESWLADLELAEKLPGKSGEWTVEPNRGDSGMPGLVIQSPLLADGSRLLGHIEVAGRGMPEDLQAIAFSGFFGVSVEETEENFFDPTTSDEVPKWIRHLRLLYEEVLKGREAEYGVELRARGKSIRPLGIYKVPLAERYLGDCKYLGKGYADGWALGGKTKRVPREQLDALGDRMAEIFRRWYEAERRDGGRGSY